MAGVPLDEQSDPEGIIADTLLFIIEQAKKLVGARRLWLFGSHASGRARRYSDIDVAVEVASVAKDKWGCFAASLSEDAPTLLDIDAVDIER